MVSPLEVARSPRSPASPAVDPRHSRIPRRAIFAAAKARGRPTPMSRCPSVVCPFAIKDVINVRGEQPAPAPRRILGNPTARPTTRPPSITKLRAAGRDSLWTAATWTSSPWAARRKIPPTAPRSIRGTLDARARRLLRAVAPRPSSRRMKPSPRSAPTPAARSASPRLSAASSGSSPPTAASRASASSPSPRRSIRSARFTQNRARRRRSCSTPSPARTRSIPPASTSPCPTTPPLLGRDLKGIRLGMPREYFIGRHRPAGHRRRSRRDQTLRIARRRDRRSLAAQHRARRRRLLHRRHRRVPPRTSRASTASATATARRAPPTCSTNTAAPASEGFGPEVKAPHHPRHLRPQQRLLRGLLRPRAKGPHPHPPRLHRRV